MSRRRRSKGKVVLASTAAVLAVGGATAAATGLGLPRGNPAQAARSSLPPATATVTRQNLVDTQTEGGSPDYGTVRTLTGRLSGTLTWLPGVGTVLRRGQALYRVDDTPVTLLYGTLPAYRVLKTGDEGADVTQLERNLYALGYRGFTVDDTFSAATATAVRAWQEDLGLPQTGVVEPGRIAYAAGPVRVAEQKGALGDPAGGPVLTYTATSRVVTVDLDVADERLATLGSAVTVVLPDGREVTGKIAAVATVVQPGENNQPASTKIRVTVSVADQGAFGTLGEATVEVRFTASRRTNVLTVPIAALLALAEGGYAVQVVDGGTAHLVGVQTGLFADGRVEVTGTGLTAGTVVGMPS